MRPTLIRRITGGTGTNDRAARIAAILAAGLERLLRNKRNPSVSGEKALDCGEDTSVTTDCPAEGAEQESGEHGD